MANKKANQPLSIENQEVVFQVASKCSKCGSELRKYTKKSNKLDAINAARTSQNRESILIIYSSLMNCPTCHFWKKAKNKLSLRQIINKALGIATSKNMYVLFVEMIQ